MDGEDELIGDDDDAPSASSHAGYSRRPYRGGGYRGRGRGGPRGSGARGGIGNSGSSIRPSSSARDRTEDTSSAANDEADSPDAIFDRVLRECNGNAKHRQFMSMFHNRIDLRSWAAEQDGRFVLFSNDNGYINRVGVRVPMARMCNFYDKQGCTRGNCLFFHLCKSHICGHCEYGEQCSKNHHFQDEHNRRVLQNLNLASKRYTEAQLMTLICCSSPHLCPHYNEQGCRENDSCAKLHVCCEFVMRKICRRPDCQRTHDFMTPHAKRILASFHLDRHMDGGDEGIDIIRRSILIDRSHGGVARSEHHTDDATNVPNRGRGRGGYRGRGRRGQNRREGSQPRHRPASIDRRPPTSLRAATSETQLETIGRSPSARTATETSSQPYDAFSDEIVVRPKVTLTSGYGCDTSDYVRHQRDTPSPRAHHADDVEQLGDEVRGGLRMHDSASSSSRSRTTARYPVDNAPPEDDDEEEELYRPTPAPRSRNAPPKIRQALIPPLMQDVQRPVRSVNPFSPRNAAAPSTTANRTGHTTNQVYNPAKSDYICVEGLKSACPLGKHCADQHYNKAYCWLIQAFDSWLPIHNVESRYRDPNEETVRYKVPQDMPVFGGNLAILDFDQLNTIIEKEGVELEIKRLSTRSACEVRGGTVWMWYWQDEDGKYQQYDTETNIQLERDFLRKSPKSTIQLGRWPYEVQFQRMRQINLKTSRERHVRRRPTSGR